MKIVCPSCQAPFEADAAPTAGPGLPLCEACSNVGDAPPLPIVPSPTPSMLAGPSSPLPATSRRQRPKVPELSFRPVEAKVAVAVRAEPPPAVESAPPSSQAVPVSISDLEVLSSRDPVLHDGGFTRPAQPISVFPCGPGPMSRRGADLSSDDFASDVEPVSLHDLGIVLAPGAAPPAWSGSAGAQPGSARITQSGAADLARMAELCPAPGPSVPSVPSVPEASPALVSAPLKRAAPIAPPPLVEAKDGGARDTADSGIVDLRRIIASAERRLAGNAPPAEKPSFFRVDPVPTPAIDVDLDDEPPPSSSRADLMSLVALPSDRPRARAAEDLLHLDGGLFGGRSSLRSLPLPDPSLLTALLAPVMNPDRVSRTSVRPPAVGGDAPRSTPPPRTASTPPPSPGASVASGSGAPGPVVSERRPAAVAAAQGSGAASWAVVLGGVVAACVALGFRLGTTQPPHEEARAVVVSTATSPSALPPVDRPVVHAFEPRLGDTTSPPPSAEKRAVVAPVAPAPPSPVTHAVDTARAAEPAPTLKERVVAIPPPIPTPAVVPAPAGGAEFDRGAAKAALASAASAAAGCKQGDDPAGGARVSVTFAPSGRVTSARIVSGPFQGTKTGSCIAQTFRTASVPPFSGDPVTVAREVSVQ